MLHARLYTITIPHVQGCVTKVMVIGIHSLMYNLEEVCLERAAYRPKDTSAGITATGYAPGAAVASSVTKLEDSDEKETTNEEVPEDVQANLDGNGVYNTPTY